MEIEMMDMLLRFAVWSAHPELWLPPRGDDADAGQATTEYALVLLGAAMVALLLVAWATAGGGAGKVGRLLDRVIDTVLSKVQ